jgi:pyruvate-ferredoxin/flavodoxin oxidoreductase
MKAPGPDGKPVLMKLSRQLVLFCVERRKAWRLLQSKAGIANQEYAAQRALLADVDAGTVSKEELFERGEELFEELVLGPAATKTA